MKKLSVLEQKTILGGTAPLSECSVSCTSGTYKGESRTKNCGVGVICTADTANQTISCGSTVHKVCEAQLGE